MKPFSLSLCLFFIGLMAACSPGPEEKIIILQTGRMAGNAYPLKTRKIAPLQHYPYLAGYLKQVRAEAQNTNAKVLLIDSGDSLTGSFASHVTKSQNMVTLFNELGYDALLLGNLDANCTPEILASINAPVLSPFSDPQGQPLLPNTQPVQTLTIDGFPVQLIANFFGDTPWKEEPTRFPMWFGPRDVDVRPVRNYQAVKNASPAPTLTLFHWMKFSANQPPQPFVNNLIALGVDAILAHQTYTAEGKTEWKTGDYSQWPLPVSSNILQINRGFTLARLDLARNGGKWEAEAPHQVIQLTANTAPADQDIIKKLNRFAPDLQKADTVLGILPGEVSREDVMKTHMIAMAQAAEADAVIYSHDSIRAPLARGSLSSSTLFLSLPWTTRLETLELSREQILKLKAIPRTVLFTRRELPEKATLITSRFFARLVQQKLNLPVSSQLNIAHPNEFEFFRDHLSSVELDTAFQAKLPNWEFHNL